MATVLGVFAKFHWRKISIYSRPKARINTQCLQQNNKLNALIANKLSIAEHRRQEETLTLSYMHDAK